MSRFYPSGSSLVAKLSSWVLRISKVIGGTGVTDKLQLQGTEGNGTATASAIEMLVGNNGGTTAMTIANNGEISILRTAGIQLQIGNAFFFTDDSSFQVGTSGNMCKILNEVASATNPIYTLNSYPNSGIGGSTNTISMIINSVSMMYYNDTGIGIKTVTPSIILGINGNEAREIGLERHTTANTAGNNLTIQAGGATSGATDKLGGTLKLYPGVSTGNATGNAVEIYTYNAGASGVADQAPTVKITIASNGQVTIANLAGTGNRIVQVDTNGVVSASTEIITGKLSDATAIALLIDTANWDVNGTYIGAAITGTYEGQYFRNDEYYFTAYADNDWIRLPRA